MTKVLLLVTALFLLVTFSKCSVLRDETSTTSTDTTGTTEITTTGVTQAESTTVKATSSSDSPSISTAYNVATTASSDKCSKCCADAELAWLITIIVGCVGGFLLILSLVLFNIILCRKNMFIPSKLLVPINMQTIEPAQILRKQPAALPVATQASYVASIAAARPVSKFNVANAESAL